MKFVGVGLLLGLSLAFDYHPEDKQGILSGDTEAPKDETDKTDDTASTESQPSSETATVIIGDDASITPISGIIDGEEDSTTVTEAAVPTPQSIFNSDPLPVTVEIKTATLDTEANRRREWQKLTFSERAQRMVSSIKKLDMSKVIESVGDTTRRASGNVPWRQFLGVVSHVGHKADDNEAVSFAQVSPVGSLANVNSSDPILLEVNADLTSDDKTNSAFALSPYIVTGVVTVMVATINDIRI